jgi:hypothetical protein
MIKSVTVSLTADEVADLLGSLNVKASRLREYATHMELVMGNRPVADKIRAQALRHDILANKIASARDGAK